VGGARGASRCDFWWHLICTIVWILLHRIFSFSKHIRIEEGPLTISFCAPIMVNHKNLQKGYAKNTFTLSQYAIRWKSFCKVFRTKQT
jgi:hypothetical protein